MGKYDSRIVLNKKSKQSHELRTNIELVEIELYKDSIVWEIDIELLGGFLGSMTETFHSKEEAELVFANICKHYDLDGS